MSPNPFRMTLRVTDGAGGVDLTIQIPASGEADQARVEADAFAARILELFMEQREADANPKTEADVWRQK